MGNSLSSLAAVCMLGICSTGCDGVTSLSGRILDEDKNPISEASVTLRERDSVHQNRDTAKSRSDGAYGLMITHAPGEFDTIFEVEKSGYTPHREIVVSGTWRENYDVVLERED